MNVVVDAANIPQMPAGTNYNQAAAYIDLTSTASTLYSLGWKSTQLVQGY